MRKSFVVIVLCCIQQFIWVSVAMVFIVPTMQVKCAWCAITAVMDVFFFCISYRTRGLSTKDVSELQTCALCISWGQLEDIGHL